MAIPREHGFPVEFREAFPHDRGNRSSSESGEKAA